MKIAIYIPSYNLSDYFYKVIKNFMNFKTHEVHIKTYTINPLDLKQTFNKVTINDNNFSITPFHFDASIKQGLAFKYRDHLIEDKDKYDLFVYCEDDILINESVINTFIEENKQLSDEEVIGVLRYEAFIGGKYLTEFDETTAHTHSLTPVIKEINNRKYFSTENVHQGCWILERRNLNKILIDNEFVFKWGELSKFGEISEDAASNVYGGKWPGTSKGLNRIIPIDKVDNLLVHHLSNKYIKKCDSIWSINKLKEKLNG